MIKFIIMVLMVLLISTNVYTKDNNLYIYQNNKIVGQFTPSQFKKLVEGADAYAKEIKAEKSAKTLRIDIVDKPYKLEEEGLWSCRFSIKWIDDKGKIIKEIKLISEIQIPEGQSLETIPKWRIKYRNVAEKGFPAVLFMLIVIILL